MELKRERTQFSLKTSNGKNRENSECVIRGWKENAENSASKKLPNLNVCLRKVFFQVVPYTKIQDQFREDVSHKSRLES